MSEAAVWKALEAVQDPEFPVGIVDLGMVYGATVRDGRATVTMTFTSIGCPAIDMLCDDVREAVRQVPGVKSVEIEVVWSPPWTRDKITERGRQVLAMCGVV